jgi:basic membrane lipoprotein Med (substrate-binding protein (PBP1-ABC) superfamily)
VRLVHVEKLLVRGGDARSVLTSMLQKQQAVVYQLVNGASTGNPYNSAHFGFL